MEIVPGIHRVDGVRGANSYLVVGEGLVLVIDTGMPGSGKKIVEYIKRLGRRPDEAEWIVLTHADIDHSGSAAELKQMTGAKVAIHEGDASSLSGESKPKKAMGIMAPVFKMMPKLWEEANPSERRKLLVTMLDAVYVDAKEEKRIVAIKPKPPFRPVFQVATTKEGSGVMLLNEPPESTPKARACFWWRRGRVELPVQRNLPKTCYRLS